MFDFRACSNGGIRVRHALMSWTITAAIPPVQGGPAEWRFEAAAHGRLRHL
jgi:hypothetical protein